MFIGPENRLILEALRAIAATQRATPLISDHLDLRLRDVIDSIGRALAADAAVPAANPGEVDPFAGRRPEPNDHHQRRDTFGVPLGFVAVRDERGRATGQLRYTAAHRDNFTTCVGCDSPRVCVSYDSCGRGR